MKNHVDELKSAGKDKGSKNGRRGDNRRSNSRGGSKSGGEEKKRKYTIGNMKDEILGKAVIK